LVVVEGLQNKKKSFVNYPRTNPKCGHHLPGLLDKFVAHNNFLTSAGDSGLDFGEGMRKGTSGLGQEAGAGIVDLGFGEGDIGGGRIRREKIGEEDRGLITPKSRDHCSTSQCGSRVSIR
jgi:hypothetical protein